MATTAAATQIPEQTTLDRSAAEPADEVTLLRRWSYRVLGALVAVAAGSAAGIVLLLPDGPAAVGSSRLIGLALLGGTLGSTASALRSTCERLSCGFVLDDGVNVWPANAPKGQKMTLGIIPFLLVRPFLGAATGLVAYAGVVGGFLIATPNQPDTFSPQGILFFALLAGLFAKTFLHRMDVVFKTLLGDAAHSPRPPGDS